MAARAADAAKKARELKISLSWSLGLQVPPGRRASWWGRTFLVRRKNVLTRSTLPGKLADCTILVADCTSGRLLCTPLVALVASSLWGYGTLLVADCT
eukprot:scaffold179693_cov30-Tisochrysis_lutea.AAC.1